MDNLNLEDFKYMVHDIIDYIFENKNDTITGEGERILTDIEEIINSYAKEEGEE